VLSVLLISGSGPTDRNGDSKSIHGLLGTLRHLAEQLARNGIAGLRYDKLGSGQTALGPVQPAQVLLAWGVQRGSALLTSSVKPARISENFDVTALPESAMEEINERLETRYRFNSVVDAGEPGFIEVPA
jgi:diketogulonate reductase-like aldo/keto reductase